MKTGALQKLLPVIVGDRDLHARWLNTFSFLEYIGVRKIIKSQLADELDFATLLHANEESRHALMLKKLCLRVGGSKYDDYHSTHLLRGGDAETYFQTIDQAAHARAATKQAYLAVTWIVEIRALEVYGAYLEALSQTPANPGFEVIESSLRALLKEEDRHLENVMTALNVADLEQKPAWLTELQEIEQKAY